MKESVDPTSSRARKARLAAHFSSFGNRLLLLVASSFVIYGSVFLFSGKASRLSFLALAIGLLVTMWSIWYQRDLSRLPTNKSAQSLSDVLEPKLLAKFMPKDTNPSPRRAWVLANTQWQAIFICNHLLLPIDDIALALSDNQTDMLVVWQAAEELRVKFNLAELNGGTLVTAAIITSQPVKALLSKLNLSPEDILEAHAWLQRLNIYLAQPKPYFGGIGRDWATGYTPNLDRFGQNISIDVERGGGHFHTLAHNDVLDTIIYNLDKDIAGIALIGEIGTGKTSLVYALAQRLLEGKDKRLKHYQIVSLNASMIVSSAGEKLENLLLTLFGEAVHAGNMIIFLDEAHLFLGSGTGTFDASEVLQPIMKNRQLKIMAAFTPNEFQQLKIAKESLASSFVSVAISEPQPTTVMSILEDTALTFEQRSNNLVSYQAIREAFRLSGQYMQEEAYPGKAINLLEQAAAYAEQNVITAQSVASAIEKTRGVRVSAVQAPEADILLNLEERIHRRMINQTRAVSVVAAALRRTRAGVASTKRPVGSFLFLGPTGVGKTELARSLAASYYGNERQIIRLDMSEYQQPSDVERLLSDGGNSEQSLILAVRKQPFSVILLDEIEKAHPTILNLLLQMLDEGKLTDKNGRAASFTSAIIITTSNAGSAEITQRIKNGQPLEQFERPLIEQLIAQNQFKPELVNRFDEIVLFRPLDQAELGQVASLMIKEVNTTLANQNITVKLTDAALSHVVEQGYDPQFGARPMRRTIQKLVEDAVATRILRGDVKPGQTITLDVADLAEPKT